MTAIDPLDEQKAVRLRQRLWGAAVLIALLVIFLPLLLDGAGSESQYRRVERLRAEPPRVLDSQGVPEAAAVVTQPTPESDASTKIQAQRLATSEADVVAPGANESNLSAQLEGISEPKQPAVAAMEARSVPARPATSQSSEPLKAWVVQAGSFGDEANAIAVRDKLRRAGYPSFVTPTRTETPLFRVRVGPMINLQQAEANRDKVMRLLSREAIVVSYP